MVLPTDPPVFTPGMRRDLIPAAIAHARSAARAAAMQPGLDDPIAPNGTDASASTCRIVHGEGGAAPLTNGPRARSIRDTEADTTNAAAAAAGANGTIELGPEWALPTLPEWRTTTRVKTNAVALTLCLNIGVQPPDQPRPAKAATLQAWVDPFKETAAKSLDLIAKHLQQQYEVLQPRAKYRLALDPTLDDVKKLCSGLRRLAKDERVLFHFNGHGVPKPTPSGEIWVFNKTYTQYIPVSVYDLQSWLGSPAIYVWDCSAAGNIVTAFNQFAATRDAEAAANAANAVNAATNAAANAAAATLSNGSLAGTLGTLTATGSVSDLPGTPPLLSSTVPPSSLPTPFSESIQLASCAAGDTLPWTPDLPADVFTACLTTPITMALQWHLLTHASARAHCPVELAAQLPGRLNDRRTPLGELNWIFTAVTDTIAWSVLPRDVFRRLFRQDLLVAGLFRNYLLAQRILKHYGCNPMTSPALPATDMHPLWIAWDLVVDMVVDQLPGLLGHPPMQQKQQQQQQMRGIGGPVMLPPLAHHAEYAHSPFFAEQLTAFDVWLVTASAASQPPLQLPIVLQVLLSQHHRTRALIILSRFLDLGPWAVAEALQVGIFPYVLKLLQSPAPELKPVLVFIWTRILAVDPAGCQADLMKEAGYAYFVHVLSPTANLTSVTDVSEHRAMCAFILATLCHGYRAGQQACLHAGVLQHAALYLGDADDLLRQWACIAIAQVCHQQSDAILHALDDGLHAAIARFCLADAVTEVRAAAALALGTFLQLASPQLQPVTLDMVTAVLPTVSDAAPLVRAEGVIALACFVSHHRPWFEGAAERMVAERNEAVAAATAAAAAAAVTGPASSSHVGGTGAVISQPGVPVPSRLAALVAVPAAGAFEAIAGATWKLLLMASVDPDPAVAKIAQRVVDAVIAKHPIYPPCSTLFERQRRFFAEPQILPMEIRQQGSVRDLERKWTFERNRKLVMASHGPCVAIAAESGIVVNGNDTTTTVPTSPAWSQALTFALPTASSPLRALRVHAFEDLVFAAQGTHIGVWSVPGLTSDTSGNKAQRLTGATELYRLEHGTAPPTAIEVAHEDAYSLLMSASADGAVRVWRDVVPYRSAYTARQVEIAGEGGEDGTGGHGNDDRGRWIGARLRPQQRQTRQLVDDDEDDDESVGVVPTVATSWRAAPDLTPPRVRGAAADAVVLKWIGPLGMLAVAGAARTVRLWDLDRDQPAHVVHTRSAAAVTALACDVLGSPHVLVAGGADGAVRVLDVRAPPADALVAAPKEHPAWCVGVECGQRVPPAAIVDGGSAATMAGLSVAELERAERAAAVASPLAGMLVSASAAGDLKLWDLRSPTRSVRTVNAFGQNASLSAFAMHPYAPLAVAGSAAQQCKLVNMATGAVAHSATHYEGFLGQRLGKVTAAAFHPLFPTALVGAGPASAPIVTVYRRERASAPVGN
ncbi:raptor N-terminal caspase like domain-containing protein [Blastocladiella britannica]|nr:raptor N-terminal caspase like domain-containing protein [Blastocladiella britannica]